MNIATCKGLHVTYKRGFGLDDWIYSTLYIPNTRNYKQYSAIAILHAVLLTVTHALGFSVFTSRILATDLSQPHCNLKSHLKSYCHSLTPFLPLFCSCQFRRLDSIQFLCSQALIPAGWRPETRLYILGYCVWSCILTVSFYKPRHRPHRKRSLYSWRGVFTAPLPSNRRTIVERVCLRGNVFTESLPSNGINVTISSHTTDLLHWLSFSWVAFLPTGKSKDSTLNLAMTVFFHMVTY
jgi:hypothetical protein